MRNLSAEMDGNMNKSSLVTKKQINSFLHKYLIYIVLLILVVVLSGSSPAFLTKGNILTMLRQLSINGIVAVGMTFVIITGGIDLSVGSIIALSGIIACNFSHPDTYPIIIPILIGIVIGLICGLVNGFVYAKGNVVPFIATLGMMTIARGLTQVYNNGMPVTNVSDDYGVIGGGYVAGIPIPILIFVLMILLGVFVLNYTKFGRYVFALGGNEMAAKVSGINVTRIKIMVYGISGVLASIAGIVLSSRVMAGTVVAGQGYELDAIAAVAIGGTSMAGGVGSIVGTTAGVLIIGVMNNGLDLLNISSYYQQIIKGIIIVAAVYFDVRSHSKNS